MNYGQINPANILGFNSFFHELCDILGSLEADPYAVSEAVSFQEIKGDELVEACSAAIAKQDENLPAICYKEEGGICAWSGRECSRRYN